MAFLSPITLGTVQLGLPYGVANAADQPSEADAFLILDAAVEGGIRSFDTAPSYGRSEAILGRYFAGKPTPSIISKWSLLDSGTSLREQLEAEWRETAARLGITRVPAMLLHRPMLLKSCGAELTALLREFVRDGRVGKVGVSLAVHVDREFEEIWPVIRDDLYEIVQIPYNVLDQRLIRTGALEKLRQAGKQVLARSAYLQGLFFLEEPRLPEHLKAAAPWLEKLRRLADEEGMTVAEFAFSYVRHTPGVTSVLVGAETVRQLQDNLAMQHVRPLAPRTIERIRGEFAGIPEFLITPAMWKLWK